LLMPLPSTFLFRSALSTIRDNDLLLVVSRRSTQNEKTQIADLPSGTMRRISRARSIVSGVELWHPAKPLLENRVEFVHCIVIIMHCLHKTMFAKPVLFSKTPPLYSNIKTGSPEYFVLAAIGLQTARLKQIKIISFFSGGSRTGQIDPNDHPQDF
jgi:hypothetical protein